MKKIGTLKLQDTETNKQTGQIIKTYSLGDGPIWFHVSNHGWITVKSIYFANNDIFIDTKDGNFCDAYLAAYSAM